VEGIQPFSYAHIINHTQLSTLNHFLAEKEEVPGSIRAFGILYLLQECNIPVHQQLVDLIDEHNNKE